MDSRHGKGHLADACAICDYEITVGVDHMSNDKQETMSFREGVDRMVDRAILVTGLNPDTANVIQACNAKRLLEQSYSEIGSKSSDELFSIKRLAVP